MVAPTAQIHNDKAYFAALEAWQLGNTTTDDYRRIEHVAFMENIELERDVYRLQKEAAELQIRYFKTLLQEDE